MGVDQRFMVNRRIGFILVEYHATVGANDGAGVFQRDQILRMVVPVVSKCCASSSTEHFPCDCRNSRMAARR